MEHRDRIILEKIRAEVLLAADMMGGCSFEAFNRNEMLRRAICMTVINIGELVKNLSADFRYRHKSVPWKEIAGFRDIAAHKYQSLHMADVYETVLTDFPALLRQIEELLK